MKRKHLRMFCALLLISLVFAFPVFSGNANPTVAPVCGIVKTEWMKSIPDTLPMCKLSIPGTHDSGATRGGRALKTQTLDIPAQLQAGIRAFDIRLAKKNHQLGLFHSDAFQGVYWEKDVLPALIAFLQAHPSETLIVSLKREGGAVEDYASLLAVSLRTPVYQPYFMADFSPELTLKDCRGKILFLHRDHAMDDYPGAVCIGWEDNATCLLTLRNKQGKEGIALLQDEYQYESGRDTGKKIDACIAYFDKLSAEPSSSRTWGISFVSATGLPSGTPLVFAYKVNKTVADYLSETKRRNCGIVFIDFIDGPSGRKLVKFLIENNFHSSL